MRSAKIDEREVEDEVTSTGCKTKGKVEGEQGRGFKDLRMVRISLHVLYISG